LAGVVDDEEVAVAVKERPESGRSSGWLGVEKLMVGISRLLSSSSGSSSSSLGWRKEVKKSKRKTSD